MENKKITVSFELTLIIISMFSFPYMIAGTDGMFEEFDKEHSVLIELSTTEAQSKFNIGELIVTFIGELKDPMIPIVSASEEPLGAGCCEVSNQKILCSNIVEDDCNLTAGHFADGASCTYASFCTTGCCYNRITGKYNSNVLERSCGDDFDWVSGGCDNVPGSKLGCCSLGTNFLYVTKRECEIQSGFLGIDSADWDDRIGGFGCSEKAMTYKEGACVTTEGNCRFGTKESCTVGEFHEGVLCTNEELNTYCDMTKNTACKPDRYEVYFKDSCGNFANVYDASKVGNQNYWNNVVDSNSLCDAGDGTGSTCGNCDFGDGLICAPLVDSSNKMDHGNFYCNDLSCNYTKADGEIVIYKNGESWCDFDGAIGNGRDTVGSKHWRYSCNQGVIEIGGCNDYRGEVCVESETSGINYATCALNNWQQCIYINSDKQDSMDVCDKTTGCYNKTFAVGNTFNFSVCLPEYPAGIDIYAGAPTCDLADVECSVIRKPVIGGGCKIIYNEECLTEDYVKEMNKFCSSLGDCGGSVNFDGEYVKNFDVDTKFDKGDVWNRDDDSPETFGSAEIARLSEFADYVISKQVVEMDYSKEIEAKGFSLDIDEYDAYGPNYIFAGLLGGIGGFFGEGVVFSELIASSSISTFAPLLAVATAVISAAFGAYIGLKIAEAFGVESGLGFFLAAAGGAAIFGSLTVMLLFNAWNPVGWAIVVLGGFFVFLSWLVGEELEAECNPINVSFDCQSWTPPSNGDNCEACNGDPLKPCSDYRCESLGACELIDKDGSYGICHPIENDGAPVIISPLKKEGLPMPSDMSYNENSNPLTGFSITKDGDGDCIDAYNSLMFGVNTSKRVKCRFGEMGQTFDEMSVFGADAFVYEHIAIVPIANPGGGVDVGGDSKVDASLEIKCQDIFKNENVPGYSVRFCVNGEDSGMPPNVIEVDPDSESFVGFNDLSEPIKVITNEPADCRWSLTDIGYESMANYMECNYEAVFSGLLMGYVCTSDVDISATEKENTYYIRCADQPLEELADRNIMPNSYIYNLTRPDKKIEIDSIKPDEDIESGNNIISTELEVKTSGGGDYHYCMWSFSGYETMIPFFNGDGENVHTQTLNSISSGVRTIYINCSDETGDLVSNEMQFTIIHDDDAPILTRIWQTGSSLNIITDEESECVYSDVSCSYNWDDEEIMSASGYDKAHTITVVSGKTYYIKCRDEYENMLTGRQCLVEVQAV